MMIGWVLLLAAALTPQQQKDLRDLDDQIKSSLQEKKRHEALAYKYADRAYNLQNQRRASEARNLYDMEAQEKEIAKYLDLEIKALERCKEEILSAAS